MGGEFLDTDEERTGTSVPLLLDLSLPSMEVALQRPDSRPDLAFFFNFWAAGEGMQGGMAMSGLCRRRILLFGVSSKDTGSAMMLNNLWSSEQQGQSCWPGTWGHSPEALLPVGVETKNAVLEAPHPKGMLRC